MARLLSTISKPSQVQRAHAQDVDHLIKTMRNDVIRNCVRAVEHCRHAWLARSQCTSGGGAPLDLSIVEEGVKANSEEINAENLHVVVILALILVR